MLYIKWYKSLMSLFSVIGVVSLLTVSLPVNVTQAEDVVVSYKDQVVLGAVTDVADDGKMAVVSSNHAHIGDGDENNDFTQIYLLDIPSKALSLVSKSLTGEEGNARSEFASITGNGKYVLYKSYATNLVAETTEPRQRWDWYIFDLYTNSTIALKLSQLPAIDVVMSDDVRYIAYLASDGNRWQAYLLDRAENTTITIFPPDLNANAFSLQMTPDGKYIVMGCKRGLFRYDVMSQTLVEIKKAVPQIPENDDIVFVSDISPDGQVVVFNSLVKLIPQDTNNFGDVYLYDFSKDNLRMVSQSTSGMAGNSHSYLGKISPDNSFVAFSSRATNLDNSLPEGSGVLIHNLLDNTTTLATKSYLGEATSIEATLFAIRGNGKYLFFYTTAVNLVPNDLYDNVAGYYYYDIEGKMNHFVFSAAGSPSVLVTSGFDPSVHGWPFDNTAKTHATWNAFRGTYGSEAIEWRMLGIPFAYENAKEYYRLSYAPLGEIGICYGMITTAAHRYAKTISLTEGVNVEKLRDVTPPIIQGEYWLTSDLTNYLYQYHGKQLAAEQLADWKVGFTRSMTDSVRLLQQSIDSKLQNPQALILYGGDNPGELCEGHAVLPYAYSQKGNTVEFTIYDPNHSAQPGKVTVNSAINTWTFDSEPILKWGSQYTCTVDEGKVYQDPLFAMSLGFDTHVGFPTWDTSPVSAASKSIVPLRQLYINRQMVATIQGGSPLYYIPVGKIPGQKANYPKLYLLDTGKPISLTLQQEQAGESSVTLFDPQTVITIKGQAVQGAADSVTFAADASSFTIKAGEVAERTISIITGDSTQQYRADLSAIKLNGGGQVQFTVGDSGKITVTVGIDQPGYQAHFLHAGIHGTSEFTLAMPSLVVGGTHLLEPNWTESTVTVMIDKDSNGTVDHQETIVSVSTQRVFMPLIKR